MKFIDWFKNKKQLIDENAKIKKGKENIESKFNQMLEDLDEIKSKYINLLEQKSEKFDLYIKYLNQCDDLTKEKRELKRQLAESTEMYITLSKTNEELNKQNEKLERKIKKIEKSSKNEKSA